MRLVQRSSSHHLGIVLTHALSFSRRRLVRRETFTSVMRASCSLSLVDQPGKSRHDGIALVIRGVVRKTH